MGMGKWMRLILLVVVAIVREDWCCSASKSWTTFNVLRYGGRGNGVTDSTEALAATWRAACEWAGPTRIFVPKGRYLVRPLVFEGPCNATHTTLRLDGTLIAPLDYRVLGAADNWLLFRHVNGLDIVGGALDAKGPALWACKASSKSASCPDGATTLRLAHSKNIKITGLLSLNSQMFHLAVTYCEDVEMRGVRVIASGESPNTDGIHVQQSNNVAIFDSSVKTGDDCVSIGPGTRNLWIQRMSCGPGHGISIGSLAKDYEEEGVQNVTVTDTSFRATQNGLRIKTWARPSKSFVRRVRFSNITMRNVQNPLIIDQNYCPRNINCPGQVSGVQISDVLYKGVKGTSTTEVAVAFDCSTSKPCKGITLDDVNITFKNREAKSLCSNANGNSRGTILPHSCLS